MPLSMHTPLGAISIAEQNGALVALDWGWGRDDEESPLLCEAARQLHAYFDCRLASFDLPLAPAGTAYQQRVWQALTAIPRGSTQSYCDVAKSVGGSPRSVGGANARNPLPIIVPCHRVVARTHLGGYSGAGGLATKRYLLALEQRASL